MLTITSCVPVREFEYTPSAEHSVGAGACGRIVTQRVQLLGKRYYLEMWHEVPGSNLVTFTLVVPAHTKLEWTTSEATVNRAGEDAVERLPLGNLEGNQNAMNRRIEWPLRMEGRPMGNELYYQLGISFGDGRLPNEFDVRLPPLRIDGREVRVPTFHFRYQQKLHFLPLMC
jgi:hypothetical protein